MLNKTNNYKQFKFLSHNRKVNTRQVTNLENSIKALDLTMFSPIMVKSNYIIDGQHRFNACKNLNLPIYYIELGTLLEKDIITAISLLNNNSKNWSAEDFLHLYCQLGKKDYQEVKEFMNDYMVNSLSVAIFFLSGFDQYKSATNKKFKDGKFEIKDEDLDKAREIGSWYKTLKDNVETYYATKKESKFINSSNFLFALAELSSKINYNQNNLIANLNNELTRGNFPLSPSDSIQIYYVQLANLHNKGLKDGQKVPGNLELDN
jgi:hypothetical protein